jgi:hypothetical protein
MSKTSKFYPNRLATGLRKLPRLLWCWFDTYWHRNWRHKLVICIIGALIICLGTMYGIARWYIATESSKPLQLGVSFDADYAESLGLNPQATMSALINKLGVRNFRLDSYWSDLEPSPGQYNFSLLDWQMQMAQAAHAKVTLVVGLRQPRYPECHMPTWAENEPASVWEPQLQNFIAAVVNRYKNSPSLENFQVENEYFLQGFGTCTNDSRERLISEDNLVKRLAPNIPIIIGRSNNDLGTPLGKPTPSEFSVSVYKRVWDANVTHRYLEYPFPAWYYAFLAGVEKITTGRDMILGEMQAEAWAPNGKTIPQISLAEQNKSLNAARLTGRFKYAEGTGMRTIYMWGAEYWYYRLSIEHDPCVWDAAKQAFAQANSQH